MLASVNRRKGGLTLRWPFATTLRRIAADSPSFRDQRTSFVNPFDAAKLIEGKLTAASGKPVLVHGDPQCPGHASIKIASDDGSVPKIVKT